MSAFASDGEEESLHTEENDRDCVEETLGSCVSSAVLENGPNTDENEPLSMNKAVQVVYCPTCTMPCEYCEYGARFEECLPWILENCPEALSDAVLAKAMGKVSIEDDSDDGEEKDGKKKKKRGGAGPKKKASSVVECKVVIARIQRQKKKYVTAVAGLETVPGSKIKDMAKAFGKKFSSGSSISETASGQKEVIIQGDVSYELPGILVKDFNVPPEAIFILEDGSMRPYA